MALFPNTHRHKWLRLLHGIEHVAGAQPNGIVAPQQRLHKLLINPPPFKGDVIVHHDGPLWKHHNGHFDDIAHPYFKQKT